MNADYEAVSGKSGIAASVTPIAQTAVAAVEHECIGQRFGELLRLSIVEVIPLPFTGQAGMHRVMKIVAPLRVQAVAALLRRQQDPHVVEVALRHDVRAIASSFRSGLRGLLDIAENMAGPKVIDRMDRVQP